MSSVLVTSVPELLPGRPSGPRFSPLSAGWLAMFGGVAPNGTIHLMVPLIHVVGGDAAVGRLHDRQPLHGQRRRANGALVAGRHGPGRGSGAAARSRAGEDRALEVRQVGRARRRRRQPQRGHRGLRRDEQRVGLGIVGPARPVAGRGLRPHRQRRDRALGLADRRRREDRTEPVSRDQLHRLGTQLGREVDQIVDRQPLPVIGRRLGRMRLRRPHTTRRACRPWEPAALRSARSARRSRG